MVPPEIGHARPLAIAFGLAASAAVAPLQSACAASGGPPMTLPIVAGLAVGIVLCAALAIVSLIQVQRQRRQIADLMARLDLAEAVGSGPCAPLSRTVTAEPESPPLDDVLAGRTSYVAAMVAGAGSDATSLADRTIVAIHGRLGDPLSPADLADELFVSLRTLERVLAATLECSPRQLIVTMKMREARRLLLAGDLRVGEVASRLGFPTAAHFSTRFKSFYGCAPSRLVRGAANDG